MGARRDFPSTGRLRILMVEGQTDVREHLRRNLEAAGYQVSEAKNLEAAEQLLEVQTPDLVLLDWAPPTTSAGELMGRVRRRPSMKAVPVIVVASNIQESDHVSAFEAGADDLVIKPPSVGELMARIDAVLRRSTPASTARLLSAGDVELDLDLKLVRRRGKTLSLGPTDFRLLKHLLEDPGRVHTREDLIDAVWGGKTEIEARTVDVHIGRLRRALRAGWRSNPIRTVRGVGYRFVPK